MKRDIRVCISRKAAVAGVAAALVGACALYVASETLQFTAYYPAPVGVYKQMITTGLTILARDGQNVGIGTTNPTYKLEVKNGEVYVTVQSGYAISGQTYDPSWAATGIYGMSVNGSGITGASVNANGVYGVTSVNTASGVLGQSLGNSNGVAGISGGGNGVYGSGGSNGVYGTNSSFGFGVYGISSGGTGVTGQGPTGVYGLGNVYGVLGGSSNIGVYGEGSNYGGYFLGKVHATGDITSDGNITANSPSDARLKKRITPVLGALEKIGGLRPVRFEWKDNFAADRNLSRDPQWGLVAQDVEKVLPELVSEDEKGFKRVKYGAELNMLALAAIRELQEKTARQEAKILELEAQLKTLRGK